MIGPAFQSVKAARTLLATKIPALPEAEAPLERLPYITPQTIANALSLVISAVCYGRSDSMTKVRAELLYEKIYAELSTQTSSTSEEFKNLLQELMIDYLTKVTTMEKEPERPVDLAAAVAAAGDGADAITGDDSDSNGAGDGDGAPGDSDGDCAASSQAEPAGRRGRTPAAAAKVPKAARPTAAAAPGGKAIASK